MSHVAVSVRLAQAIFFPCRLFVRGRLSLALLEALVVTGFPLWDLQQISQCAHRGEPDHRISRMGRYFARFGELRTILGANKNKGGKRSGSALPFGTPHSWRS